MNLVKIERTYWDVTAKLPQIWKGILYINTDKIISVEIDQFRSSVIVTSDGERISITKECALDLIDKFSCKEVRVKTKEQYEEEVEKLFNEHCERIR